MIEYKTRGQHGHDVVAKSDEGTRFFNGLIASLFWGFLAWMVIAAAVLLLIWIF